ncbi:MAG: L-serine ammonia-lyase [Bacteroidetes bacterium]|nr:L-serine ammonia-lyase [Bacteroidota bacterium]
MLLNDTPIEIFNPIKTSVFELFKVGPGPSSSHTIGPMRASFDFLQYIKKHHIIEIGEGCNIRCRLFGSLSATGKGHGTDRAVLAGLLGWLPEQTDPDSFAQLWSELSYQIKISDDTSLQFHIDDIIYDALQHSYDFSNTILFELINSDGNLCYSKKYYSIGGGFIQWDNYEEPEIALPPYCYQNMKQLKKIVKEKKVSLHRIILENEKNISGMNEKQIYAKLEDIINAMCNAVERGINTEGVLPGFIKLPRKASNVYKRAKSMPNSPDSFLIFFNAYSLAASEENAAGNLVVTAPTSGASGVIPGVIYMLKHHFFYHNKHIADSLLACAAIGFLVKHNASISGAEAGCMGEVGTAAGMAAALLTYGAGYGIDVLEMAAEIAIEHHLGMTCDPVGGFVQIPCIERNAVGAVKAYNAYLLALSGDPSKQKVTLDQVIKTVRETGRDMSTKYKETSQGGLALNLTEC